MSIAQQVQLRDLAQRLSNIEATFQAAAEVGNTRERLDNLESTMNGVLLELKRLSAALAPQTKEAATKESQGAQCQSSPTTTSARSSGPASAARSTGATASSAASARTP